MPTIMSPIPAGFIITLLVSLIGISVVLGGIAWSRTISLFLPFPTSISAIATLFPFGSLFIVVVANLFASRFERAISRRKRITTGDNAIETATLSAHQAPSILSPFLYSIFENALTILPTILATLAATYIAPSDNNCHLEQAWQTYYRNKDVTAIRSIQDRLQCCGLRSTHDRAWPFKERDNNDDHVCEKSMGYKQSCLEPWSENERRVAVLVFVAAIAGLGIKLGFLYFGSRSWTFNNSAFRRGTGVNGTRNGTGGSSAIPRMLPYYDDPNNIQNERDEIANNNSTTIDNPLLDADAHDITSPDVRDLSGSGPWRNID
ncbi:hypothetical protein BGW36DRAFT_458925 [Talaromyces proteolyticus]|uniref:Tetraspanin Tsp3 n=1 Tax=Talaromyces proteolyticus TaxID=1131652 RepID=A0AAD4KX78_9EURO|nr:uncharacterized protein BGW36DRAFT_458925 [Talaromyces proteolyticus]KAH8702159.1 hypothetical protein BGW36DRAFT_458925 [Talaromyces proteolyticus]